MGLEGSARERRRAYTRDEVSRLAANGADLLVIDSIVCDFSSFSHPGGRAVLRRHAGEDVSDMFAGVVPAVKSSTRPMAHDGADVHAHSAAARSMLARLAVGYVQSFDSATTTAAASTQGGTPSSHDLMQYGSAELTSHDSSRTFEAQQAFAESWPFTEPQVE